MNEENSEEKINLSQDGEKKDIIESISEKSSYQEKFTDKVSNSDISRRNFLKTVGLVGGGVTLGAIGLQSSVMNEVIDGSLSENLPTGKATHSNASGNVLNVLEDYGAVGDGQTDDSDAIEQAINDASEGDTVYLPAPDDFYAVRGQNRIIQLGPDVADNVTITGDGKDTVIKFMGGNAGYNFTVLRVTRPIIGLEIKNLVIDGGSDNVEGQPVAAAAMGVNLDSNGEKSYLIEDCIVKNALKSGLIVKADSTTVRNVTAYNNGMHGIGAGFTGTSDNPVKIQNCYTYDNGWFNGTAKGIDASKGSVVVSDCVIENNAMGTKVSDDGIIDVEYHRVRVQNNDGLSFNSTNSESGEVVFDKMVFGPGGKHIRASNNLNYVIPEGSEIVVTGLESNNPAFQLNTEASLDASGATIWSNNNATAGLGSISSQSGNVIDTYNHGNNDGGPLGNTDNLQINEMNENIKEDIEEVPTADEVGAFVDSDNQTENGEDQNQGSAYTAQEHTIELDADGNQPVNYYFKVGESTVTSSDTGGGDGGSDTGGGSDTEVELSGNAIYMTNSEIEEIKSKVNNGKEPWNSAFQSVKSKADSSMNNNLKSVVDDGAPQWDDPHRFGRDDQRHDYLACAEMGEIARNNALAYIFSGEDKYAERAVEVIHHWFLKPETYMLPTVNIANNNTVIEQDITIPSFIYAARLLGDHSAWQNYQGTQPWNGGSASDAKAAFDNWVKEWRQSVLDWETGYWQYNNHWAWRIHAKALTAAYLEKQQGLEKAFCMWRANCETAAYGTDRPRPWSQYRQWKNTNDKGYLRREREREDGFGYHVYGTKALTFTAEIADTHGVDLYSFNAPTDEKSGSTLKKVYNWMIPYCKDPSKWEWGTGSNGVTNNDKNNYASIYEMAYSRWGDQEYKEVIQTVGRPAEDWYIMGPTTLTHGSQF